MKHLTFFLLLPLFSHAQLYTNASNNLPDNGAMGQTMDVRAADLDGDGDLDIVLANEFQPNTILLNDGNGVFTNGTAGNLPQENHDSEDVAIADFNDLYICDRKTPQSNNKDLLLLRNPLTAIENTDTKQPVIIVFPNPVSGDFFIKTNLKIPATLNLTDSAGRIAYTFTPENQGEGLFRCPLPKGKLVPGVYFIEIGKMRKLLIIG